MPRAVSTSVPTRREGNPQPLCPYRAYTVSPRCCWFRRSPPLRVSPNGAAPSLCSPYLGEITRSVSSFGPLGRWQFRYLAHRIPQTSCLFELHFSFLAYSLPVSFPSPSLPDSFRSQTSRTRVSAAGPHQPQDSCKTRKGNRCVLAEQGSLIPDKCEKKVQLTDARAEDHNTYARPVLADP